MNLSESFFVKPGANERVETTIHLHKDPRPALFGVVLDPQGRPVEAALAAIYEAAADGVCGAPVGSMFTDAGGQFAFGPLTPDALYQVRVYQSGGGVRTLELRE